MSGRNADDMKRLIVSCCSAIKSSVVLPSDLPDDFDLRQEGIVDSLGFIALLTELETRLGHGVDVDGLDPEDLTRIGPLARHIAAGA
jgi:hypothetical protein